jgi:hypothetical protein
MDIKFSNNASSRLALALAAADTIVRVVATTGNLFPTLVGNSDYFMITITDTSGKTEIIKVTQKNGDMFTVVRAQEGTTARDFPVDSVVEHRLTAGSIERILNDVASTTTVSGRVRIATNPEAQNMDLTTVAVCPRNLRYIAPIPGIIVAFSGEISQGQYPINTRDGSADHSWRVCDGTAGTPDLRDRFILGASNVHAAGSGGGSTNTSESLGYSLIKSSTGDGVELGENIITFNSNAEHYPPYYALVYLMKVS